MRFAIVVFLAALGAAGCGAGVAKTRLGPAKAELLDAIDRKNVDSIYARLAVPFTYAGMYFPDEQCATRFAAPAQIGEDLRRAFAECVAALPLRASAREGAMAGLVILDYAPGIEIEVVFHATADRGSVITRIGYTGRSVGAVGALVPTVTPGALEVSRLDGDPIAELSDLNGAALTTEASERGWKYSFAWLRVCLDAEGAVSSIDAREVSSSRAEAAFRAAIANWKFKPVVLGGKPAPVCAMFRFVHPAAAANEDPERLPLSFEMPAGAVQVPAEQLERVAGTQQIVPEDRATVLVSGIEALIGAFSFCVDPSGAVTDVKAIEPTGRASYDAQIMAEMARWRYKPFLNDGTPIVACSAVSFVYTPE